MILLTPYVSKQFVYIQMSLKSELCDCSSNPNFIILNAGSGAGIVKIWDLSALLGAAAQVSVLNVPNGLSVLSVLSIKCTNATTQGELITPLRRVNMKGILHYPIKDIFQSTYTDLVIIAKYEGKEKKDKVKVIEVKWN